MPLRQQDGDGHECYAHLEKATPFHLRQKQENVAPGADWAGLVIASRYVYFVPESTGITSQQAPAVPPLKLRGALLPQGAPEPSAEPSQVRSAYV